MSSRALKVLKHIVSLAFIVIILAALAVFITGGNILSRWSTFLADCEKVRNGDTFTQVTDRMKKYIDDPRYNYMLYSKDGLTSISFADGKGFHLKTWRCQIELKDDAVTSVNVSI